LSDGGHDGRQGVEQFDVEQRPAPNALPTLRRRLGSDAQQRWNPNENRDERRDRVAQRD